MASVLKSRTIGDGTTPTPTVFNMEDVQGRARSYLDEIQQEANQILVRAKKEAEQICSQAMERGIAEAQTEHQRRVTEAAQQLSDKQCRTATQACEATISELTKDTANWLAIWRNRTVDLAAQIAEKLVRREMQDQDELLRVWLEEALAAMRDNRDIRVLVHPDDFAVTGRFLQNLAKSVPQAASVEIVPDAEITLGGCVVRSNNGQIDQQLETQLERLVEQLT